METSSKAIRAMSEIVKRYPHGTASLFTGVGIKARPTGRNLTLALRKGHITPRQLYAKTLGTGFDDFNPMNNINMAAAAGVKTPGRTAKDTGGTKFENIVSTLLGTANQAAEIYGKFKNPGQGAVMEPQAVNQPEAKSPPWGLIAAGAGLVIVLVVVLIMLKKK